MARLLVVDDEPSICWGVSQLGESMGHEVATASSAEQALDRVVAFRPDVVVLDVRLPGMDGLAAIARLRELIGPAPIIIITAHGDLQTAVEAVRSGAFEYMIKPFDLERMERALNRALASGHALAGVTAAARPTGELVGSSAALREVFKHIALAAASNAGVLLYGESGTGKELAARSIHKYSERAEGPFVAVNVASLSATLAESELFGHTRGAFTGADQDRVGLLVQADGGTLFLDEVADIPLPVQVKLLRALEHGEVTPVGAGAAVPTNFRVVSATHQDLLQRVKDGAFRHDLYFRLGAFRIDIPPLRRRRDDIRELAEHFLSLGHTPGEVTPVLSDAAASELERRPWHGNVRELRNAMEHAVVVARAGVIEPEHLPQPADAALQDIAGGERTIERAIVDLVRRWAAEQLGENADNDDIYGQLLRLIEPPLFLAALENDRGQCSAAARRLGIHRTTLRKKLDQYEISEQ